MQKVLRKRILRDFKTNIARYLALGFLIILSMYLVISMLGAAETIIRGSLKADADAHAEDGEFSLFVPMKESEEEDLRARGITLEKMFFLDYTVEESKTLRLFENREEINQITLKEGSPAAAEDEVVLERRYAEINGIQIGDKIEIGGHVFRVVGIGTVPDYDCTLKTLGDTGCDSQNFGLAFVTADTYQAMRKEGKSAKSEEYYYAYLLNDRMTDDELKDELKELEFSADDVQDAYFQEYWDRTLGREDELRDGIQELVDGAEELKDGLKELKELKSFADGVDEYTDGVAEASDGAEELQDGVKDLKDETDDIIDEIFDADAGNLMTFVKAGDNARIQAASGDQELYRSVGTIAGCIILVLISYVLSVFVVHSIDRESSVIGALYALGVKKRDLMNHYVMLPTVIAAVSGVIGTLIGYSKVGVRVQMQDCYNYYSLPDLNVIIMPYLLIYGVIAPPLICWIVTSLVINKRLSKPVLTLIKNEQKVSKGNDFKLKHMKFMRLFKLRQIIRERRTAFTVVFGMFVSLLIAIMAMEIFVYCDTVRIQYPQDTKYEYMYTYKYPSEEVPKGGYKAYAKTMKKAIYGYTFDVTVLGITEDNPFFNVNLKDTSSQVVISSAIAYKYGLKVGDVITLKDEEADKLYAFEIYDITQYSPSFMVFMPYDKALELFGEPDDYYNVVFSDHDLEIESGRLYSTITKTDVEKAAGIFVNQMQGMIITLGMVSVIIFAIVLYLMMKVMIDRSAFSISLIKIFGYRDKELKKMYLDGNFYVIAIGALLSVPLGKMIMDAIYEPAFTPNVACGVDKSFSVWIYLGIFALVFILYFIINHLLVRRIRKMIPAEVLKNRE
jgi:putative ABC transport system permease protein